MLSYSTGINFLSLSSGRHKGARRQFTDFEAESERKEREEKEATWRVSSMDRTLPSTWLISILSFISVPIPEKAMTLSDTDTCRL